MMRTGRNEPCPCGSGKKYKKCCLAKDQAAEQAESAWREKELLEPAANDWAATGAGSSKEKVSPRSIESASTPAPEPPPDPHMEALNARWLEFEALDTEGRRILFLRTLDEPELMDDEMAYEMLNSLRGSAVQSGELDEWEDLVVQLQERFPDVYATSRGFYVEWRIEIALQSGRLERVPELARDIAETAGDDVDQYSRILSLLAYHGQLEAMLEASHIAWPLIQDSSNILWGQRKYASWGADCVLFQQLEQTGQLDGHDPDLIEKIRYFIEDLVLDHFAKYVTYLSGRADRTWSLSDFGKKPGPSKKSRKQDSHDAEDDYSLTFLLLEFIDYARHQEGVPYTKAALARDHIAGYIRERDAGELVPRPSMWEAATQPQRKPKPKPREPDHPLCPDRETLDGYFAGLLHFMNPKFHAVAATMELIPAWLRFLETRGLLEPAQREATMADLGELHATLWELFLPENRGPSLFESFRGWHDTPPEAR